eukprot:TRINITY_DN1280_c0_g1_i4.p1 TRINITY_DN1280_c0_g1~~TRINITY_DN1280_c0_g1_i4.p1  ORF type:complete len:882 (-),score=332.81 TRINITY_DN1280_c0_g1_i4:226-2871(-)
MEFSFGGSDDMDDEAFAKMLQQQFDAENNGHKKDEQLSEDMKLALQLAEEDKKNFKVEGEKVEGVDKESSLLFELDRQMALKFQEEIYAEQGLTSNIEKAKEEALKPQPVYNPPVYNHSNFHLQPKNQTQPSAEAISRLTRDIKEIFQNANPQIHIYPDEEDITHIDALIVGPPDTPYQDGFFHFDMVFPSDYPWKSPAVQLVTTDNGAVRFNPNLYACGKVCLSILGTWQGPKWTQIQTMNSVLLSIQSLMCPSPYHNEPGYEQERASGESQAYNDVITHETLRVAVCGMMENPTCEEKFIEAMNDHFLKSYDRYLAVCQQNLAKDGTEMNNPFGHGSNSHTFDYQSIIKRLEIIKEKVEKSQKESNSMEVDSVAVEEKKNEEKVEEQPAVAVAASTGPVKTEGEAPKIPTLPFSPMQIHNNNSSSSNSNSNAVDSNSNNVDSQFLFTFENVFGGASLPSKPVEKKEGESAELINLSLDPDAELARKLQEEEYESQFKVSYKNPKPKYPHYGYNQPEPPKDYKPVKINMSEIMKEVPSLNNGDQDRECLICHSYLSEYVILPNCKGEHIYCVPCVEKLVKSDESRDPNYLYRGYGRRGGHHQKVDKSKKQQVKCTLCQVVSFVDPNYGVKSLRRKKRRVDEMNGTPTCFKHNNESYCLFCFDCFELVCFTCVAKQHQNHKVEALDTAQANIQSTSVEQLSKLESKRDVLQKYIAEAEKGQAELEQSREKTREETKAQFAELRKALDAKEAELLASVDQSATNKRNNLQREITKSKEHIDTCTNMENLIYQLTDEKDNIKFLKRAEIAEEDYRHVMSATNPEVKKEQTMLQPVQRLFSAIDGTFQQLKYPFPMIGGFSGNYYGYDEGAEEYNEEYDSEDDE